MEKHYGMWLVPMLVIVMACVVMETVNRHSLNELEKRVVMCNQPDHAEYGRKLDDLARRVRALEPRHDDCTDGQLLTTARGPYVCIGNEWRAVVPR